MAEARANVKRPSTLKTSNTMDEKLRTEGRKQSAAAVSAKPVETSEAAEAKEAAQQETSRLPVYSEAPPSYEDAIATDLPPVDAPRPDYAPPPAGDDNVLRGDEKKGLRGRRDSE